LPYQRLVMQQVDESLAYSTYTSPEGVFVFSPVPPGAYEVFLGSATQEGARWRIQAAPAARIEVALPLPAKAVLYVPFIQR